MAGETRARFGPLLRILRKRSLKTQLELATVLGFDTSLISRIERGVVQPRDRGFVLGIVDALDLDHNDGNLLLAAGAFPPLRPESPAAHDHPDLELDIQRLKGEVEALRETSLGTRAPLQSNRDVQAFLRLLQESEFIQHADRHKADKVAIASEVVRRLRSHSSVALDSGTSTCEVAYRLIDSQIDVDRVYTNNLVAAIHLVGARYTCVLPGGELRLAEGLFPYAALLGKSAANFAKTITPSDVVLGASHISSDEGPFAPSALDRSFKGNLVKTSLRIGARLFILADCSKFLVSRPGDLPVLSQSIWREVLHSGSAHIITAGQPDSAHEREVLKEQLAQFPKRFVVKADARQLASHDRA